MAGETRFWNDIAAAIRLGTLFVVLVAACSLTVATIGGLIERRRPFALLRASGVRLGELRRIMLLETGLDLLAVIGGGLLAALAISTLTLPLLDAATRHHAVRYE